MATPVGTGDVAAPAGQEASRLPVEIVVELGSVERHFSVMAETLHDISG